VRLTNYTKRGEIFVHQLSAEPLCDPAGVTKCFQATSLVLQPPGEWERSAQIERLVRRIPLVCKSPLPPLWTLLGRTIRPEEACKLSAPKQSTRRQASGSSSSARRGGRIDSRRSSDMAGDHRKRAADSKLEMGSSLTADTAGFPDSQVDDFHDNEELLAWLQVDDARTLHTDELAAVLDENDCC